MKKLIIVLAGIVITVASCKSNKAASASSSSDSKMEEQLTAVKLRFPDATKEELKKGHSVYQGACTKCHGTKDVTIYTEEKLLGIVDVMSSKANLTTEEKQALIRFAVGVRATTKP